MKREDVLLLIASFVIAIGLWLQVQPLFEPGHEREFFVSLQMENKPEDLFVNTPVDNVTVVASGTLADLDKLDTSKVVAYIDLENAKTGDSNVPIQIRAPADSNLQFRSKSSSIRVTSEQIIRENRKVKIITTGTPEDGLILANTIGTPDSVELFGPKSNVSNVKFLQVTVDLARLKPGQSITAPVAILDEAGDPVPATFTNPAKITVAASFTTSTATRSLPIIVNWTGEAAPGFQIDEISVEPNHIDITGKSEIVSTISTIETEKINIAGIKANKEIKIKLIPPPGVTLMSSTAVATIKVKRK
jgi:YbbR domain-containing protein